ncbi:hypothetical protein DL546_009674 [Coniochaeta pulveracea]|uniref:Uncharacterized protein n=1 Tax=Coniochaeta pulveracea TaxID=177199 RepID=A0A420YLG3_9PEZI|nr:hypothetical protein DL546_009674 [Coniochaeta pulveracea]
MATSVVPRVPGWLRTGLDHDIGRDRKWQHMRAYDGPKDATPSTSSSSNPGPSTSDWLTAGARQLANIRSDKADHVEHSTIPGNGVASFASSHGQGPIREHELVWRRTPDAVDNAMSSAGSAIHRLVCKG